MVYGEIWKNIPTLSFCPSLYGALLSVVHVNAVKFSNYSQVDIEYRKEWDSHVIKIEKVDEDKETGSEIIYWATHFPVSGLKSAVMDSTSCFERTANLGELSIGLYCKKNLPLNDK